MVNSNPPAAMAPARLALLVVLALTAFAGNSLLTRAALEDAANAPATFAAVRLAAGAIFLGLLGFARKLDFVPARRDWKAVCALLVYALGFSFAYVSIGAAIGALILFASVQFTMVIWGLLGGQRLGLLQIAGLALAISGLVWLLSPGLGAPPIWPALTMMAAGIAWGVYSISGQGAGDPVAKTARNFLGTLPAVMAVLIFLPLQLAPSGWALAIASGVVTSAIGYVIWYAALPWLSSYAAANLQLAVPVITALGGILWLGEVMTLSFIGASAVILTGIALTLRR